MWDEPSGIESLIIYFLDGGMVWLLFSASGFMGGTLAARVNVLILMVFKEF